MAVDKAEGEEGWWMLSLKAAPCPALVRCATSSGISASVAFCQTPLQSWRKTGKKNEKMLLRVNRFNKGLTKPICSYRLRLDLECCPYFRTLRVKSGITTIMQINAAEYYLSRCYLLYRKIWLCYQIWVN